jgi:hypothetical protein
MNGLLTYDRNPKVPPEEIKKLHDELFSPRIQPSVTARAGS